MYDREIAYRSAELVLLSRQGVPCLIGNTGVGKTDMVKQIAEKHNKNLIIINTSVMNADDLAGYPYLDKKNNKMKWGIPDWFPTEKDCMIFLDEFNRADKQVINALMPLLLSGELHHGAKLPEDTWMVVAFNPDTEDYDMVNSFDDLAISSRLVKIIVNNDSWAWSEWAQEKLNSNGKDYIDKMIEYMREYIKDNDVQVNIEQLPNNRSFSKAIGVIDYVLSNNCLDYFKVEVVMNTLKGILGVKYVEDNDSFLVSIMTSSGKSVYEYLYSIIHENFYDSEAKKIRAINEYLNKVQDSHVITEKDIRDIENNFLKDNTIKVYNRTILLALKTYTTLDTMKCIQDVIDPKKFDRYWNMNVEED